MSLGSVDAGLGTATDASTDSGCSSTPESFVTSSLMASHWIHAMPRSGRATSSTLIGEFHDQEGAKWVITIRPSGDHTPGRPIGRPGVGCLLGVFYVFSYYQSVMLYFNMVCLTVALAFLKLWKVVKRFLYIG
jgi:hypothetical protein